MRKPNYLSTRFGSNISHVVANTKTSDIKKWVINNFNSN